MTTPELNKIAESIANCRVCDLLGLAVSHSAAMDRGKGRLGMVVGIQPGNVDVKKAEAFSGLAGKRLMQWLVEAGLGADRKELFDAIYFTSLAKCASGQPDLKALVRNCRPFLIRQIELVNPKVFITLGIEPMRHLFGATSIEPWIGRPLTEHEIRPTLFPLFPTSTRIFVLPHPSPLSRWTNEPKNKKKLSAALKQLGEFIQEQ